MKVLAITFLCLQKILFLFLKNVRIGYQMNIKFKYWLRRWMKSVKSQNFFRACDMKKENQDKLENWKEEIQEYKEFELFFSIVDFNEKLLAYSQDYYDGKFEISLEEFNEERSCYLAMEKACLPMLSKFGVDPDSFLDRENGSYWKWYNFWNNWMESFSDEAWDQFQSRLEKKESVEIYLPYGKWDK